MERTVTNHPELQSWSESSDLKSWIFDQLLGIPDEAKRKEMAKVFQPLFCGAETTTQHQDEVSHERGSITQNILHTIRGGVANNVADVAEVVYGKNDAQHRNRARALMYSLLNKGQLKHNPNGTWSAA